MENLNKIYLSFPPNLSNDFRFFKSEKVLNKKHNIFPNFKTYKIKKDNINNKRSRNKKVKKLLPNFSSSKKMNRIYDYINDDNKENNVKNKDFNLKKKLSVKNLLFNKNESEDEKTKYYFEKTKNNLNPIFKINNDDDKKSRNILILKDDISIQEKKTFSTNETLFSNYKDLLKIKINLNKTKNFSLIFYKYNLFK